MAEAPSALRKTVLILEDEVPFRQLIAEALSYEGFAVIEAGTGDEALHILLGSPPLDLALIDVRVPGSIDGLDLARRIRAEWPQLKVVLMSGYLKDMAKAEVADAFLGKPFPLQAVIDCVKRLLGI